MSVVRSCLNWSSVIVVIVNIVGFYSAADEGCLTVRLSCRYGVASVAASVGGALIDVVSLFVLIASVVPFGRW